MDLASYLDYSKAVSSARLRLSPVWVALVAHTFVQEGLFAEQIIFVYIQLHQVEVEEAAIYVFQMIESYSRFQGKLFWLHTLDYVSCVILLLRVSYTFSHAFTLCLT